jgi:hypothetical protein
MDKGIKRILQLARKRVELYYHFSTIPQGKLLDAIEQNKTEELVKILQRPLMLKEQEQILDYLIIWNDVNNNFNEKKGGTPF